MAGSIRSLDYRLLQQCMHCGLCLPACPTYGTTRRERHSPRGRIALMRAIADGELQVDSVFAEEMSFCLGCLACQAACPAGVSYAELFETARADVRRCDLHSAAERLWRMIALRFLFMRPRALRLVGRIMRAYQRSGLEAVVRGSGLVRLLPAGFRRLEARSPRIARRFSNALIGPQEQPRARAARYRVALLTGCIQDLVFSGVNRDTADVLLANDCQVESPPVQPCCGSLHAHNGDVEAARILARRLLTLVPPERYDAIITNAGGCGSHLRHYGRLLADDAHYAGRAAAWDEKVRDVHEWLVEIAYRAPLEAPMPAPVTVAYHESCHLAHGQRVVRPPRDVLQALPGVALVELPGAPWCCGSAGIYSITQPAQSDALLAQKVEQVLASGAKIVATANPGCCLQMEWGLNQLDSTARVSHPISLLAAAYRREAART